MEARLFGGGEPVLENLAIAAGSRSEAARGDAGGAMEGAHEVREVGEARGVGHVGDRAVVLAEEPGGAAQAGADQVLMRGHAEDLAEGAQEMEGREARVARRVLEVDRLVGVGVDPERRLDRASAIAGGGVVRLAGSAGDDLGEARREEHADFVETEIAAAVDRDLRQLAQHHQLGQRRDTAELQPLGFEAERVEQSGSQLERQTFVAAGVVVVGAEEFVARMADQDRAGDELVTLAANATTEAAFANVGERVEAMDFGVGDVAGRRRAAVVDHLDRAFVKHRLERHVQPRKLVFF